MSSSSSSSPEATGSLVLLPEDDCSIPINEEDIFSHEALVDVQPLVKVKFCSTSNIVYAHSLEGIARWLMIRRTDPLVRNIAYTEEQVSDIRRRFGFFSFLERAQAMLSPKVVEQLRQTKNDIEKVKALFETMDARDLTLCLFSSHRVSFRIFCAIYEVGSARGFFDVSTIEMFLSEGATDAEDPRFKEENAFFTLRLFRLFHAILTNMPYKQKMHPKIRQTVGHLVVNTREPSLRPYLSPLLLNHRSLVPQRCVRQLAKHARKSRDGNLSDLLIKCHLVNEGLIPRSHPQVRILVSI